MDNQLISACDDHIIDLEKVHLVQENLIDNTDAGDLARIFQALADATRVRMVSALAQSELCVCDLATVLGMTQSAISHQLKYLRDLQMVKTRRDGRIIYYSLRDNHIHELYQVGITHIKEG
jgi:ArsR family transcriptional regulator